MSDVVMVCVRDDIERAEGLAAMFEDFGFSVSDATDDDALGACGASVVIWSDAAKTSLELAAVVERAIATRKAVVLNLSSTLAPDGARFVFDLTAWTGDPDDEALDPLFFTLDRMVIAGRAAPPAAKEFESIAAWKKPQSRKMRAAPAAGLRLMALSLVVIGAVFATGVAVGGRSERVSAHVAIAPSPVERTAARVTLADIAPLDVTYDLAARPVEDAPVGRRGLEPPSAPDMR